jgi:hypothetical protein
MGGADIRCLEATMVSMFCLVVRPSSSVWWMVTLTHVGISDTKLTAAIETADSLLFKVFLSCSSALVYLSCSAAARSFLIGALYPLISSAHMVRLRPFDEPWLPFLCATLRRVSLACVVHRKGASERVRDDLDWVRRVGSATEDR